MLGDGHVRFGGRPAETEQPKGHHRAAGRPYVRHEALSRRAGMKGPRRWPVAAGRLKLRAA